MNDRGFEYLASICVGFAKRRAINGRRLDMMLDVGG
jgi:hypothetical protein